MVSRTPADNAERLHRRKSVAGSYLGAGGCLEVSPRRACSFGPVWTFFCCWTPAGYVFSWDKLSPPPKAQTSMVGQWHGRMFWVFPPAGRRPVSSYLFPPTSAVTSGSSGLLTIPRCRVEAKLSGAWRWNLETGRLRLSRRSSHSQLSLALLDTVQLRIWWRRAYRNKSNIPTIHIGSWTPFANKTGLN